jgi:hypothetical protein
MAALENAFQLCKDDCYCNKHQQNLEQRFWKIYEDLEKEPSRLKVTGKRTYEPVEMLINGSRFLNIVSQELYDSDCTRYVSSISTARNYPNGNRVTCSFAAPR